MYGYFVRGEVHGREVKADFLAKDQGGYELLDLMFSIKPTVDLVMWEEKMTDDKGNVTPYMVYEARVVDDDGLVYAYKLKLARESAKSYLNIFLQLQGA
jgi:hypothetical protein